MLSIKNHLEQWLHALFVAAVYRHWIDIDAHCELIAELLFVFLASYILDFLWLGPFQDPTVLMAHRILSNAFLVSLGSTTKYFTVAHPDAVVIPWVVHTRFAFSASGALNDVSFMANRGQSHTTPLPPKCLRPGQSWTLLVAGTVYVYTVWIALVCLVVFAANSSLQLVYGPGPAWFPLLFTFSLEDSTGTSVAYFFLMLPFFDAAHTIFYYLHRRLPWFDFLLGQVPVHHAGHTRQGRWNFLGQQVVWGLIVWLHHLFFHTYMCSRFPIEENGVGGNGRCFETTKWEDSLHTNFCYPSRYQSA